MAKPSMQDVRRAGPGAPVAFQAKRQAELDASLDWRVAWPTRHRPGSSLIELIANAPLCSLLDIASRGRRTDA